MCGILGVVTARGSRPRLTESQIIRMRDLMERRGPDDCGLVQREEIAFAHRRLTIIDPEGGAQPMWSPRGRAILIYNGELYNDPEIRQALEREGVGPFRDKSDTETICQALAHWGSSAISRFRGMFALGWYDFDQRSLLVARDPLGIKPLYYAALPGEFVFASHPPSILSHPRITARPDAVTVSSYLSTIRTTLGRRTLFDGVYTLEPGEIATVRIESADASPRIDLSRYWSEPTAVKNFATLDQAADVIHDAIENSVKAHLRSDVPRCMLLSGGLDSAIIASICRDVDAPDLMRTWCAGDEADSGEDVRCARLAAEYFHTQHHETILKADRFVQLWDELLDYSGLPLCTPNETAIAAVAQSIHGHAKVALSGEGADELFGGYALPYLGALDRQRSCNVKSASLRPKWSERYLSEVRAQYQTDELGSELEHYFRLNTWIHPLLKPAVLTPDALIAAESDMVMFDQIADIFASATVGVDEPLERALRVHRRINLTGLLGRLDNATMFASIEGRTPFADAPIATLAATIAPEFKLTDERAPDGGFRSAMETTRLGSFESKRVLRRAFASALPDVVINRPKASFPIPFREWMVGECERVMTGPGVINDWFAQDFIHTVRTAPEEHWPLAWPAVNIAKWLNHWWGSGATGANG